MTNTNDIGEDFARRLRDGADRLRDAAGALGAIEVPLSEGNTVELGANPHTGFFLRLRARLDHVSDASRDKLMADFVRLSAASRFGTGWVGGCEPGNVVTLAMPLDSSADGQSIAGLIDKGRALLRPDQAAERQQVIADSLSVGESWLRI